jgi:hypothetical protein
MSGSHSFYSDMQVWWYSFWRRFETYFINIVLRNYKSKLRSCLEYYFFFKVLTTLYCDADGEYVGWKRTDTSAGDATLRIFGSSASKRYQNFGSSLHFSQLSLFTVFVLSVAKFAYHYEGPPPPTTQHAAPSSIKDRCCCKPKNPFSQFNRRPPVSETPVCYVNCIRSPCWLCPSNFYWSGVGGGFVNKPQQSYGLKSRAQTEFGILLQLLGVLYKAKTELPSVVT